MPLQKDIVDILGTALFIARCRDAGIRVARPIYDDGVDLILYPNEHNPAEFLSHPVQLKSYTSFGFLTDQRYLNIPNLWITYIWRVGDFYESVWVPGEQERTRPRFFAMSYTEAEQIVTARGWHRKNGRYARTNYTTTIDDDLSHFEITDFNVLRNNLWGP